MHSEHLSQNDYKLGFFPPDPVMIKDSSRPWDYLRNPLKRTFWKKEDLDRYGKGGEETQVSFAQDANLIASLTENGTQAPILDIDLPCQLWESSTPGHYHLLIEKELEYEQYEALLLILADCGILENNYVEASIKRGFTAVRVPWIKKGDNYNSDRIPF